MEVQLAAWGVANGAAICFLGIGAAAGFALCLALAHERTDAILSFCGAFIGIVAAVGGGFWVWQAQDAKSIERTKIALDVACHRLAALMAISAFDLHRNTVNESQLVAEGLNAEIDRFYERVRLLEPSITQLSREGQKAYLNLAFESCLSCSVQSKSDGEFWTSRMDHTWHLRAERQQDLLIS